MDNSIISMSKDVSTGAKTENSLDEESSWTFYFEDFLSNYHDEPAIPYSCDYDSPSLISDAASSSAAAAVKKVMSDNDQLVGLSLNRSYSKSLSFKKRKTGAAVDDALEDTASSPVNSPKISYFNQLELRRKDKEHTYNISELRSNEKGDACGQPDGSRASDLGIVRRDRDYTELKKRGLCLVPLSALANNLLG